MSQDRESGARAAQRGHERAARPAEILGAKKLSKGSNECMYEGKRVVIKSASIGNQYVGVLTGMLERIDSVIGAFEEKDGSFALWMLSRAAFQRYMRNSQSLSHHPDRGKQVRRDDFEDH